MLNDRDFPPVNVFDYFPPSELSYFDYWLAEEIPHDKISLIFLFTNQMGHKFALKFTQVTHTQNSLAIIIDS